MEAWKDRPTEIANLLNPAFCGEIIRRTVLKYSSESEKPMPILLSFLVLPLLIHRPTREKIPSGIKTKQLHIWVEEFPEIKIGLGNRIREYGQLTKEAILFLGAHGVVEIESSSTINLLKKDRPSILENEDIRHPHNFFKRAEKVGIWLSRSGGVASTYSILGVRP